MIESFIHSDYQIPEITRKLTLEAEADAVLRRARLFLAFRP